jgi:hypothetical protein
MKINEFLKNIEELDFPNDKFAIFGSGPLAIRGLREAKDIDLVIKEELWDELAKKYPVIGEIDKIIKLKDIEIHHDWKPWFNDVNEIIDDADIFNGIRFVKLEHVLKFKKAFNREKDKNDVILIEKYLKNRKHGT